MLTKDIFLEFLKSKKQIKKDQKWKSEIPKTNIKMDYSSLDTDAYINHIKELILSGENKWIEYKSTLRYCLKENTAQPYIEQSALKTIAAFLNSDGGTLLIGVNDNGNILGLDNDHLTFNKNLNTKDEWIKHFDNISAFAFNNALAANIKLKFTTIEDKDIAIVHVFPTLNPVFMRSKTNGIKKQFYIRRNGSTIELDPEETLNYVKLKEAKNS